uniref:Uncharacterized protein n=2 Tax=Oryza sativa subsp. japonica TaxID=39947 RepID=Q5R1K3_ORYSJ|nr:hypothetical protein [Oryza sativa Japonica Group]ABA92816.1 hypothetical protein LOC_Os11g18470 [Oryza sativa Japonica Group]
MRTLSRSSSSVQMMSNRLGSASGREGKLHRWKCRPASFVDSDVDDEEEAEDEEEGKEEAVDKTGEKPFSPGHAPGLEHVKAGAASSSSPLRQKEQEGAKALAAIAGIALLNVGAGAKWAARGVIQVTVTHHRTPPLRQPGEARVCRPPPPLLVLPVRWVGATGQALSAQCSVEQMARVRLDSYKSCLEEELGRKDLKKEVLASSLKDANAEIKRLRLELEREKRETQGLVDYYNDSESKIKALH